MGSEENGIGIGEGAFLVGYSIVVFFLSLLFTFGTRCLTVYCWMVSLFQEEEVLLPIHGLVCQDRSMGVFFWLGHVIIFCLVGSLHFDKNGCVTLAVSSFFFFGGSAEDVYEYAYHGPRRSVDTRLKMQKYASAK